MPKFVFKLQSLLNVKIQLEKNLKNELGKVIQILEWEKGVLSRLEFQREDYIKQINSESSQGVAVGKLKEYSAYISVLKEKIENQKENVKLAQQNVDKIREELIKVVQEKEMLNKLKEKKYQEFLVEQNKAEQKFVDELVSYNYSKLEN